MESKDHIDELIRKLIENTKALDCSGLVDTL
jgi:hypothetical protein